MLEPLRPFYNTTLRPAARLVLRIGIHPNHVTIFGCMLFVAAALMAAASRWYSALVLVILGSLMDGLDGVLARESGKTTVFGGVLDSTCDRITEMVLLGGLAYYYLQQGNSELVPGTMLCFTALCASVLVSYIKARCEAAGIPCNRGILQRPERLILFCVGLLAGPHIMIWILGLVTGAAAITVIQRMFQAASVPEHTG
jgi:CDP-diacylglycerol---glycerol-3-phosphate 3-phosphatidyltransferase